MIDAARSSAPPEALRLAAQALPAAAGVYARLQIVLQNPQVALDEIIDLVKLDAGLSAAVVRAGNSACCRRGEPLESVNDAINRVGLREVHRIVGQAVAGQLFLSQLPLYALPGRLVWENSLATAVAMSALAHAAGEDERPAYTLGLLRPAGRLVLQRLALADTHPVSPRTPIDPAAEGAQERARFGVTNTEVTAHLFAHWRFAPALGVALRHHPQPEKAPAEAPLAARLHLACWIAATLGKGLPGEARIWRATPDLVALAGLPPETPQSCIVDIRAELNRLSGSLR